MPSSPPSLEDQFLASLDQELEGLDWLAQREVKPSWLGKRGFRYDFLLSAKVGDLTFDCLVEINGGGGARSGHATISGRSRDHQKQNLAWFGGTALLSFTSPQVKSGEAAEVVGAWLWGQEAPACLLEKPKAAKAARREKKAARKAAKKKPARKRRKA